METSSKKIRRSASAMTLAVILALLAGTLASGGAAPSAYDVEIQPYFVGEDAMCKIRDRWIGEVLATHPEGTWAPMKVDLKDEDLALMGLPSREILLGNDFPVPTMIAPDGTTTAVDLPAVVSFAGAGCFGIRPGAFLLLLEDGIGWCSLAHVYGSAVSTAGHCGKVGDKATVIAAYGNRDGALQPILLDFGKFSKSTDNGPGADWGLIEVAPEWQHLVSPTMCFWGGPLGMYTAEGAVVDVKVPRQIGRVPEVTLTPDPFLAQTIVHYGHGTAVGTAGTPRAAPALHWDRTYYTFTGAISPGDSGSGANTLGGDGVGSVNEAAGIMTHLWVDPLMRNGVGIMLGTRATQVQGTLTPGQIAPYPAPAPGLP